MLYISLTVNSKSREVSIRTFVFLFQSIADSFEMRSILSIAWLLPDVCCLVSAAFAKYEFVSHPALRIWMNE